VVSALCQEGWWFQAVALRALAAVGVGPSVVCWGTGLVAGVGRGAGVFA
jgi:hypothetical protein